MKKEVMERSTAGLREIMCEELDKLRSGEIEPSRAQATAKLAQQILVSVQLEITAARLIAANRGSSPETRQVPALRLVS
jgi:hypothetical protein